jgi:arabinofuranosyltransferase
VSKPVRRPELWIACAGAIIAAIVWQFRLRFPFDDTYITFRYADHLADGFGFVWNIGGPPTEGFTNFLFVILLASARLVTHDLLAAAQLIGLLSTILAGIFLYRIAAQWCDTRAGILAAALFLLSPLTWVNALSGMETSFFVLLTVIALYFFAMGRHRLGFGFALLSTLTRPEAGLIATIAFLVLWLRTRNKKQFVADALSCFVLPLLAFAVWKYFYFGNLLPNSFYIKVSEVKAAMPGLQYVRLFATSVITLIIAASFSQPWRNPSHLISLLWCGALLLFFTFVLPLEGLYDRFLWPAFTILCALAAVGALDLTMRLKRVHFALVASLILLAHLCLSFLTPRTQQAFAAHEDTWDRSMDKISAILTSLPHHDSLLVGYGDAGYVVYRSNVRHLDLFGLNDTRLAHAKSGVERAEVVQKENPDLLLLPIRTRDTCAELVEDAYGVARSGQYVPQGAIEAFPYTIVFYLNRESPRYGESVQAFERLLTDSTHGFHSSPRICY